MAIHEKIVQLLDALTNLPGAASIVVFGSVAKRAECPGDLDVALVTTCTDWNTASEQYRPTIAALRRLAHQNYGWLDPFIVTNGRLVVRNDEATGWMFAKNSTALQKQIVADGIALSVLVTQPEIQIRLVALRQARLNAVCDTGPTV